MFGDPVSNPMGWDTCALKSISLKITDGTHKTPNYAESGIEFLSAKDLKKGLVRWGTGKFISIQEHNDLIKRCNPELGDILLAKSGSLGEIAVVDQNKQFSLFESVCLIKPDTNEVDPYYLAAAIRSESLQQLLLRNNKGVGVKHLHLVDIRELIVPLPPVPNQLKFSGLIGSIQKSKILYEVQLADLDTLFASLQQRAFSGELSLNRELVPA
jgi:type I restriction enzyme S subunit